MIHAPSAIARLNKASKSQWRRPPHWGWYWNIKKQHLSKSLCSVHTSIDSFKILSNKNTAGFRVDPFEIHAAIKDNHILVTDGKHKKASYTIPIDKLACHFGGFRYFFRCPLCHKRMRLLYFTQNRLFLCRQCLNLGYLTQLLRPTRRCSYMSQKIETLVQEKGGDINSKKPPRMHTSRYNKLQRKYSYYYEEKSHQALNAELRAWYGPKAEPYIDDIF